MPLFLDSSQTCAIREDSGIYIFHDPSVPTAQAFGTWDEVVALALKIMVHEAKTRGGIPGTVFAAAEGYATGIMDGSVTKETEESAAQIVAIVSMLKES